MSLTKVTYSMIDSAPANAADFGTGTAAIQAAIDSGASKIYVPAGTWEYTGTVTYQRPAIRLRGNIEIFGDGPGKTIIKQNAAYYLFGYGYLSTDGTPDPDDNIKNIIFRDMELVGDDTPVFSQFEYILTLGCVSNVMIDNIKFRGWRGDAISIGEALGSVERHQLDITIQNCYFDGVNKDNRQAITCTDGTNVTIQNNVFVNCTRSDMPGNIDFEPNSDGAFPYDQWINNIHILNNRFSNSDAAAISVQLANVDDWTVPPGPIYISGNTVDSDCTNDMKLYYTASGGASTLLSSVPANIFVDNNYFSANGGSVVYGMNVLSITNNQFSNNFPSLTVGRTDLAYGQVVNANISGNSFKGNNTYQNIVFGQCNNVRIDNNRFETGNAPGANNIKFFGDGVTATCAAIQLSNNLFYRVAAYGAIDPVTSSNATVTAWSVNNYQQEGWPITYHPKTFATLVNDGTPTVQEDLPMVTGGTTSITNFTNGYSSQVLKILSLHSVTITNNANIKLAGATNFNMTADDTLTLISRNGIWYEMARSVN